MKKHRWTLRVAVAGAGLLALMLVVVFAVRIANLPVAGVYPEAFMLTAMMTLPFTVGTVVVLALATMGIEAAVRRLRTQGA